MINLDTYLNNLLRECKAAFGQRLLYVGLQGSYLRGEANERSDIDIMLVLDSLSVPDMDTYRSILKSIGSYDRSCGFICGREELARWNPMEVFQLLLTTKDIYGCLSDFLPSATRQDEINYVKISLGNLYHELCHRYIHADRTKNIGKFRTTCKALFFLIQNLHYLETGTFSATKRDLKESVDARDRAVLELSELPDDYDFDAAFASAFAWCKDAFARVERIDQASFSQPNRI